MKAKRIFMLTFLVSIFCVALSYAQHDQKTKATPEERAAKRVEMMKKSLNLTDEQAAKVQELQIQMFKEMKQLREASKADRDAGKTNREEMKAKREEIKAKYEAQLRTILTPEQYQQYQEQCKNMQKNKHKRMQKKTSKEE